MNNLKLITVYFDDMCVLCSTEINHYKTMSGSELINYVDISSVEFDAKKENLDPYAVHKIMHVKDKDGQIFTKVEAFQQIWKILPKYNWLYKLSLIKPVKSIMDIGYVGFAKARPYLMRKKSKQCAESIYCVNHKEEV